MSEMIDWLKKYLAETPREQVIADWNEVEELFPYSKDEVGAFDIIDSWKYTHEQKVGAPFMCQRYEEMHSCCFTQCDHCNTYYKPIEND